MKNKGFTLVELLAMLVVLGIIIGIAVPNITGILANNKMNVMKADATKMVDTAKMKFSRIEPSNRPQNGQCIVYALNYLNDSDDISTGPNGGEYLQFNSFVIVTKQVTAGGTRYNYYVRLIEEKDSSYIGMNLIERSEISSSEPAQFITSIPSASIIDGLVGSKEGDLETLRESSEVKSKCGNNGDNIIDYYPGKVLK